MAGLDTPVVDGCRCLRILSLPLTHLKNMGWSVKDVEAVSVSAVLSWLQVRTRLGLARLCVGTEMMGAGS